MVFLEERDIRVEMFRKEILDLVIFGLVIDEVVPVKKTLGVGIHHEDGFSQRVQQNGIRRFRADPVDGKQFLPQRMGVFAFHRLKAAAVFLKHKPDKILQAAGFDVEVSGGFDERGEFRGGDIAQGALR